MMLKLVPNTPVAQVAQQRRAVVCVSPVRRPGQGASSLSETGGGAGRHAWLATRHLRDPHVLGQYQPHVLVRADCG